MAIPEKFPLVFSDRANAASGALYIPEIHWILDFNGELDKPRLKRAFRLLLDAEPVLGCRMVSHWRKPFWERLPSEYLDSCQLVKETPFNEDNPDEAMQRFFGDFMDGEKGPQVKSLLMKERSGDRLLIKINHCICDAGGFKELLYSLTDIYRKLEGNPLYYPSSRVGSRSLSLVYSQFSTTQLLAILGRGLKELAEVMYPFKVMQCPSGNTAQGELYYIFRHLPEERISRIKIFARHRNATINDVFITALFRTLAKQTGWRGKTALRINNTVDLRRYLPQKQTEALCEFTGLFSVNLGKALGDSFEETLEKVKLLIDYQKANYLGLGMFLLLRLMYRPLPFKLFKPFWKKGVVNDNNAPGFTNMGDVDANAADFINPGLSSAIMVVPATSPPRFAVGLSGFAGTLTLSAGRWPSAVPPENIEAFFNALDEELP